MEQVDWHDASERAFLQKLALRLDDALSRGETNAFIVIAAPRALGMIRPAYTPAVRRAVKAEIGKDYVKMPIYEIEKTFTG
jgi:protein required for attachment to host cells